MRSLSISPSAGRRAAPLAALLAVSHLPQLAAANPNAPCYDPNGDVAPGYYPCDPTAYITNCCAAGWTCFSNSLCVVTGESNAYPNLTVGAVGRAMCTNPQWNNDICGDFCITGAGNADGDMVACGDDHFCCLGDYNAGLCNCSLSATNSGDSFVVNDGKAQTVIGVTTTFTGTVSYMTSLPTPSPTIPVANTSATQPATHSVVPKPSNSTHTRTIGLGVGLGVGLSLLAIVGFLLYKFGPFRHRHRRDRLRHSLPRDIALDGTAFGEQMAMRSNNYMPGQPAVPDYLSNNNFSAQHLDTYSDTGDVPPPPPPATGNPR